MAGTALVLGAAALQAAVSGTQSGEKPGPALPVLSFAVSLGTAASAFYGFRATNRCREAVTSWCASHDCGEPDAPR